MVTRKVVQDIVPSDKRSIRKVSMARERKPVRIFEEDEDIAEAIEEEVVPPRKLHSIPREVPKKKSGSAKYLISFILIFISLTVIAVALSLSYSKAIVTITPKVVDFEIKGDTFTAVKSSQPHGSEDLTYDSLTTSDTISETVAATKGTLTQSKAKGVAIIYNNYSASPQVLVAGTRIANTSGFVYRTTSTVTIPGKKTNPGSLAVNVVADQAGADYNVTVSEAKTDFKLIGYKGTDKYAGFYARLKTDITGGFSGNKMTINADVKKAAIVKMQNTLKERLLAKLNQDTPKDSILYPTAFNIEYEVLEPVMLDTSRAELTVKGIAYGAIFNSDSLIKYIAGREIKRFPSDTYTIEGARALEFKISNTKDFSIKKNSSLIFTLQGPISINGIFSEEQLKKELAGTKLDQSNAIFAKYTSIANAYALITPFWMRSFPNSVDKITIEYKH